MKGFAAPAEVFPSPREGADPLRTAEGHLTPWALQAVDAVGTATEFWGFKRNHGRVWALLYLDDRALSAQEIQEALELSKGAVSMIVRELETWGVLHRVREPGEPLWRFVAETDLMAMIGRVLEEREAGVVARVKADLAEAEAEARAQGDDTAAARDRLARMRRMAEVSEKALALFLRTSRLDLGDLMGILKVR